MLHVLTCCGAWYLQIYAFTVTLSSEDKNAAGLLCCSLNTTTKQMSRLGREKLKNHGFICYTVVHGKKR